MSEREPGWLDGSGGRRARSKLIVHLVFPFYSKDIFA